LVAYEGLEKIEWIRYKKPADIWNAEMLLFAMVADQLP
jgi:hypothetical protein